MPPKTRKAAMTSEELRRIIAKTGLTQEEFAGKLEVNRRTIIRWLNGDIPISRANAILIKTTFV